MATEVYIEEITGDDKVTVLEAARSTSVFDMDKLFAEGAVNTMIDDP